MRLGAVTWGSDMVLLIQAARDLGIDLKIWSVQDLDRPGGLEDCLRSLEGVEAILLHPASQEEDFQEILDRLGAKVPIVSFGHDQALWSLSNVPSTLVAVVNAYIVYGGLENTKSMLKYIGKEVLGLDYDYSPPEETLWQGLYHPDSKEAFRTVDDYLAWRRPRHGQSLGILFFRTYWANGDLDIVNSLIRDLERDFDVLPAFCFGMGDKELGARSSGEVVEEYFLGRVDAVINMQSLFHAGSVGRSVQALKSLDVPVFHPLTVYHRSEADWRENIHGMDSSDVGWSVAMSEFEGMIEPIVIGASARDQIGGSQYDRHTGIDDRLEKITRRVRRWMALRRKPVSERRVAFMLHNNPCASVEATVGAGAHLDTLESVARIMLRMADAGYSLEDVPRTGKDLITRIMDKKAISEFRWTPVEEIVARGGALALVAGDDYQAWFDTLSPQARDKVCNAWGNPPGEEKDGIPPAMIYQGKIVVTGLRYGNVLVCVQPKRGCAGARCDGQVCKILHDPEVPPTHQYLATYRYIEHGFGADVIVHVGTHGNLEFLPGKSLALSGDCYPDIAIGEMPHLYIYNSDNPPEGTIAKRRSYAVLVDHMQTVMTESGLYGDLKELEDRIAEYSRTRVSDKGRAHALEHIILDLLEKSNLSAEMGLDKMLASGVSFDTVLETAHGRISEIYSTQMPDGMHVFGEVPKGEKRVELINSILRYDSEMRKLVARMLGIDLSKCRDTADLDLLSKRIISAFLEGISPQEAARMVLGDRLKHPDDDALASMREKVADLSSRIEASDEMGSLLHGFDSGFIEPGPSGLITRGRDDVLPTGRNFFSLDPSNIPTEAAWRVGRKLAESLINKYRDENGRLPENVAMFWMANDIMWADGEQLAQMMHLIGAEPQWKGGKVRGFRIIPLDELGRPRIDLTVRVSGITRDCFMNCIEYLDEAIRAVSSLDEPTEMNYLRKHSMDSGEMARLFASRPGTYGNGVNLAVYASAWKEEKDLADIFLQWNSYAYGKNVFGQEAVKAMKSQLKSVDVTFNKTVTDEYDLFGCCCYFGTHGGLTSAARGLSGHEVATYYGDTRDRDKVEIRTLAEEVRRVVRTKLLNPKWIEGMKQHGYKGASDISKRVGRVYGWEATTQEVDDWIFDDIARTFILDEDNRKFFQENNPWAMEEMGRRLLEANQRGLWKADPEVIDALKSSYLEVEGWMEEMIGDSGGSFQGGSIDVVTLKEVQERREKLARSLKR
ncbi:MAG TPA: cobaltochelatase subunit CobN [Methanotrichaceae archaeon]|nr:cobaltochelatase subunit CobN [Methanotrichaceae archaeon]